MRITLSSFLLLSIMGCSQAGRQNNSNSPSGDKKTECEKSVSWGDIDICLPAIDGMTECYETPIVKARVDEYNNKANFVLAYYLNNHTFKQLEKFGEEDHDDYFRIFAVKALKNKKDNLSNLEKLAGDTERAFYVEKWADVKKNVEKNHNYLLSIDKPILIERYKPTNDVVTLVLLNKLQVGDHVDISIMTLDLILIKKRIIMLAYVKDYEGEESIKNTKSKNDYIALRLLDENR